FKDYVASVPYIKSDIHEVGCGEGSGVELLIRKAETFTAVDKIKPVIDRLKEAYPKGTFLSMNIPPLSGLESNRYDVIVTFQVIEHIENDRLFLQELHRVLKPGGVALITTPNRRLSLTRNPWH